MSRILDRIEEALERAGSPAALSRVLGVSEVQIGRVRNAKSGLSVETALALAVFNEADDPARVLEDAGHPKAAKNLRLLYGTAGRDKLTSLQQELHRDVADIDAADWRNLRAVIRRMADDARRRKKKR